MYLRHVPAEIAKYDIVFKVIYSIKAIEECYIITKNTQPELFILETVCLRNKCEDGIRYSHLEISHTKDNNDGNIALREQFFASDTSSFKSVRCSKTLVLSKWSRRCALDTNVGAKGDNPAYTANKCTIFIPTYYSTKFNVMPLFHMDTIQSTLVISNSKGLSEILRDIRTSTYQISRIEEPEPII